MKLGMRRTAVAIAVMTLITGAAFSAASAAGSITVNTPEELINALSGGDTAIVLGSNITITNKTDLAIPSGMTVYVNGKTWDIGDTAVTGTVDTSTPGSAVLRTKAGSVQATANVYVACTIALAGAADGETVTSVTADGGSIRLYDQRSVLSGSVTVYVPEDALGAMGNITAVGTTAGNYVLSNGGLVRYYSIQYKDIVDASGSAPQQASNAATLNPAGFAAGTTQISLSEPSLMGYKFLGWTWEGQSDPLTGAVSVDCSTRTSLTLTAHWEFTMQGGGGRSGLSFGIGSASASGDSAEEEEPEAAAAQPEETAQQSQSARISRGSSSTKVVFSDGGASKAAVPAATQTTRFPWILAAVLTGAAALGIILGIRFRKARRTNQSSSS